MACVIPFPAPRPAAEPDRYALLRARAAEIFASAAAEQGLTREPQGLRHEEEILQLLRRIDCRLARLATVPGNDFGRGIAGQAPPGGNVRQENAQEPR